MAWEVRDVDLPELDWANGLIGRAPGGASGGPASAAGKVPVASAVAEGTDGNGFGSGGGRVEVEVEGYGGVSSRRYSEVESIRCVVRGVIVRADARKANNDMAKHGFW